MPRKSTALVQQPKNALIEAGLSLLEAKKQKEELEQHEKALREFIFQGMKKNRLKALRMDDGTSFVIKDGNRKVIIKDQKKAEAYLEEMSCWKIDTTKLLNIFGRQLKVPPFFKVERGAETLAIMPPKFHA